MGFLHLAFWPPVSLKLSATLLVFTRFFLSLFFFNRRGKGVNQHESSHNQKVPFFSLPNEEKKKGEIGRGKTSTSWQIF